MTILVELLQPSTAGQRTKLRTWLGTGQRYEEEEEEETEEERRRRLDWIRFCPSTVTVRTRGSCRANMPPTASASDLDVGVAARSDVLSGRLEEAFDIGWDGKEWAGDDLSRTASVERASQRARDSAAGASASGSGGQGASDERTPSSTG